MSLVRKLRLTVLLFLLLLSCTAMAYGQASTYRQAAQTYRAMAANASGAAAQCDIAYANYYDSVANNLLGQGSVLPQPTCTPGTSSGGGRGGDTGGVGSGLGGLTTPSMGGNTQAQQLMSQGVSLLQGIFAARAARKAREEQLRQEQAQQEADQAQQQAIAEQQRAIEAAKQREMQLNDDACQLLVQSRALLGETVDLAGDNACSRITDAILNDMATYGPVNAGGANQTPSNSNETVIDGSKIPSTIDFNQSSVSEQSDPLSQLVDSTSTDKLDPNQPDALQRLTDGLLKQDGAMNGYNCPPEVIEKLNKLLDAAIVKRKS